MTFTIRLRATTILLVLSAGVSFAANAALPMKIESLSQFPRTTLAIRAGGRTLRFRVWVANTMARKQQGLMFVRDLPAGLGMLFPTHHPQVAEFWMANTYIPLDILFVAPNMRIEKIVRNAVPFSTTLLSSGEPITAVIELRGGAARRLGIRVGSPVQWAAWKPGKA